MCKELINMKNNNGKLVVGSSEAAGNFGKEHSKIIRSIKSLEDGIAKSGDTHKSQENIMQKICNMCGKTFNISNFYKDRNHYDGKCKQCRNKLRNTRYIHTCEYCGKEFTSARKNTKYCSKKCVNGSRKNRITVKCEICSKLVTRPKSQFNGIHIYCSYECSKKGWRKYYSGENCPSYDPNLSNEERIKERHYQEYYKWRNDVYKRDNYTCQCCGDKTGGNLNAHHVLNYSEYEDLRTDINNGITLCDKCHKLYHDIYGYKHNNDKQLNEFLNKYIIKIS